MRDSTKKYTGILLVDPFLDGLLSPFIVPAVKFWVDQQVDAILFGYAVGAGAVLTLVFYQALDWWQKRRRKVLNDLSHIAVISYPVVLFASALGYVPALLYVVHGVNGYPGGSSNTQRACGCYWYSCESRNGADARYSREWRRTAFR